MTNNILILFAVIAIINLFINPTLSQKDIIDYEFECKNNSGKWIKEYNECEYIKKDWCDIRQGFFEECASACRHNQASQMCIAVCVPVCRIKWKL